MTADRRTHRWAWLGVGLLATLAAGVGGAQAQAGKPEAAPAAESEVDPDAVAVATHAGDFLRDSQRFSFTATFGYEVVQSDGEKLEFGGVKRYTVQRPNRVRIESEERDHEAGRLTVFDGKTLTIAAPGEKVYAQAAVAKPHDIDQMIDLVRDRLDMPMPLAELLRGNPRTALEDSLTSAYLVGEEKLRGVACDHLAFRNPERDFQLWIAEGAEPVILRIVITYRGIDGQPSFWADLSDWSFAPKLSDAAFTYVPSEGMERIRFAVKPPPTAPAPAGGGAQ